MQRDSAFRSKIRKKRHIFPKNMRKTPEIRRVKEYLRVKNGDVKAQLLAKLMYSP